MRIVAISQKECSELLKRISIGRLSCSLDDQPYTVPVSFSYEPDSIYIFSTFGKKIAWMRRNPKVCLQVDEIGHRLNWRSVVVTGKYLELPRPKFAAQQKRALKQLAKHREWWRIPLAGKGGQTVDQPIETVFFRIDIVSISGLRTMPEGEWTNRKS